MIKKTNILKVKLFSVFWESFHIFGESLVKQFDCDCVNKRLVVCNKTKTIWQQLAEFKKSCFVPLDSLIDLLQQKTHENVSVQSDPRLGLN